MYYTYSRLKSNMKLCLTEYARLNMLFLTQQIRKAVTYGKISHFNRENFYTERNA